MYGEFFAFLCGWAAFAVFNTAGTASIAYVMSTYVEYFVELPRFSMAMEQSIDFYIPFIGHIFPLEFIGLKLLTVLIVILLTIVSYRSTKAGGKLLVVFTLLKMIAIGLVIFAILFSGMGNSANFFQDSSTVSLSGWGLVGALMAATSGAFFAYDGWNNITFVGGEVENPQRNIPRSLLIGLTCCMVTYVLINMAFLYVMQIDQIASSTMVASDASKVIIGSIGGGIIALMVILSTMGTTHTNIITTARITYAMGEQGKFFKSIGKLHPKFGTPGNALLLHGVWTCALVFSGSFDTLTDMLIFVSWLFYGMTALGVFVLRRKMPDADRPYRVWGYPFVPAIFVAFTIFFLGVTLYNDIANYVNGDSVFINSVMGLFLTCLGIPLYFYFARKSTGSTD
jgi:APA family basic amino acid/polyamine antiporter